MRTTQHNDSKRHNKFLLPTLARAIYGSFRKDENNNVVKYCNANT